MVFGVCGFVFGVVFAKSLRIWVANVVVDVYGEEWQVLVYFGVGG